MSADNWTVCPKCREHDQARELLGDQGPTMREDWDIGMNRAGEFEVIYGCACETCGWTWQYVFRINALTGATP